MFVRACVRVLLFVRPTFYRGSAVCLGMWKSWCEAFELLRSRRLDEDMRRQQGAPFSGPFSPVPQCFLHLFLLYFPPILQQKFTLFM